MTEKEKILKPWMFLVVLGVIILGGLLYTIPLGLDGKRDVFFTVTVENNPWTNNPKIVNVDVYSKPSTILNTNYAMASFFKTGNLELETLVGSEIYRKNIGELGRIDEINPLLPPVSRTVSYRVPGVTKETKIFSIRLLEDGTEIDKWSGRIP